MAVEHAGALPQRDAVVALVRAPVYDAGMREILVDRPPPSLGQLARLLAAAQRCDGADLQRTVAAHIYKPRRPHGTSNERACVGTNGDVRLLAWVALDDRANQCLGEIGDPSVVRSPLGLSR